MAKKAQNLPPLKVKQDDPFATRFEIMLINDNAQNENDYHFLCYAIKTDDQQGNVAFYIERQGFPYDLIKGINRVTFATPEQAGWFYYYLHRFGSIRGDIKATDTVIGLIKETARNLSTRSKAIRDEAFNVQHEMRVLKEFVKELNFPEDSIYELEDNDVVARVRDMKLEGDDIPFFSEAKLYDLLGKEDARSVLGAINKLMEAIDPIAAKK